VSTKFAAAMSQISLSKEGAKMEESKKKVYILNKNVQDSIFFFFLAVALMVYALINHYNTPGIEWKLSPYLFPVLISVFIGILSVSLMAYGIRQIRTKTDSDDNAIVYWQKVSFTIFIAVCYYVIMEIISFVPATVLFLVVMLLFLGERRIWLIALISIVSSLSIYLLFGVILHVMLP